MDPAYPRGMTAEDEEQLPEEEVRVASTEYVRTPDGKSAAVKRIPATEPNEGT